MTDNATLKARWKQALASMAGDKGWVTKRQLADVMGIGYSTVTDAINFGHIPNVLKRGEEESKGQVRIPLESAYHFINQYQVLNPKKIDNDSSPPLEELRQGRLFE